MSESIEVPYLDRKRQLNKKRNREIFISAAKDTFTKMGVDKSSIRQITKITNLGSGTFYNYFRNKNSIFIVINERFVQEFSEFFMKEIEKADTFEQIIKIAFKSWFSWILSDEKKYLFIKNNKNYLLDIKWQKRNSKEYIVLQDKIFKFILEKSKKAKFPNNDISLMITSVIAVAVSLGEEILLNDEIRLENVTDFATRLFLKGL